VAGEEEQIAHCAKSSSRGRHVEEDKVRQQEEEMVRTEQSGRGDSDK